MANKTSAIYAIRCKSTGKVYIGRSQNPRERMRQHFNLLKKGDRASCGAESFREDFARYGAADFELFILERGVTPENFREREAYWINEYRATDRRYGYNKDPMETNFVIHISDGLPPKPGQRN